MLLGASDSPKAYDHYRVLRVVPRATFSSMKIDLCAQAWQMGGVQDESPFFPPKSGGTKTEKKTPAKTDALKMVIRYDRWIFSCYEPSCFELDF